MSVGLVDLEELILRCREPRSRSFIREAAACYHAGAYRACIMTTWIAVVLDILAKFRELELSGDAEARAQITTFENIRAGGESKLKNALEFEKNILDVASNKFQLLAPLELEDLQRLRADRNRCAHPSMQSLDDAYQPPAELARTHLRNAVEILLQREPVQGKAAFARVYAEIESNYFPTDKQEAIVHFNAGPLKRARPALIRDLLVVLTKKHVSEDALALSQDARHPVLTAIRAIVEMYRSESENVLCTKIPEVMLGVPDDHIGTLLSYFRHVDLAWDLSNDALREKARRVLVALSVDDPKFVSMLWNALQIPALRKNALEHLPKIDGCTLASLVKIGPDGVFVPRAIQLFAASDGWRNAEENFEELIIPLAGVITAAQLEEVLDAFQNNSQIWDATDSPKLLGILLSKSERLRSETLKEWEDLASFLADKKKYARFLRDMKSANMLPLNPMISSS